MGGGKSKTLQILKRHFIGVQFWSFKNLLGLETTSPGAVIFPWVLYLKPRYLMDFRKTNKVCHCEQASELTKSATRVNLRKKTPGQKQTKTRMLFHKGFMRNSQCMLFSRPNNPFVELNYAVQERKNGDKRINLIPSKVQRTTRLCCR